MDTTSADDANSLRRNDGAAVIVQSESSDNSRGNVGADGVEISQQAVVVDNNEDPPPLMPETPLVESPIDDLENRPPPPLHVISASNDPLPPPTSVQSHLGDQEPLSSSILAVDDGIDMNLESNDINAASSLLPPSRFVPGPLREEPTLKEKLVDRERQRRKEAERARLKRQFALMSNGGGLIYDGAASITSAVREIGSITGTVGEESTHADLEDSISMMMSPHAHNHNHHQGDQTSPQLGYTMERFLQEREATATNNRATDLSEVAAVAAAMTSSTNTSNVIREETIECDPTTAGAPDKGVVMERFLNAPVVVDTAPPSATNLQEEDQPVSTRPEDVHRSVSFDMELRTAQYREQDQSHAPRINEVMDNRVQHISVDDSNASVLVEVSPEDDILEPPSPGGGLSVPSDFAPSSLGIDDDRDRHHHSAMPTSLESVGPSMDQQSTSTNVDNNNDVDTDDEPRVLRLTEAEIQEMAAIEEASIGNAPPSDRDEESLVGELVGEFGSPSMGDVDVAGTTFSQGTPTTAMESGSALSGNQRSSAMPSNHNHGEQENRRDRGNMDDMDQNSIDDMAMSASVSSHLVVSPGASVSGSAVSVTANPPSEIIGRGEPTPTLPLEDDLDDNNGDDDENEMVSPLPPVPVMVGSSAGPLSDGGEAEIQNRVNGDANTTTRTGGATMVAHQEGEGTAANSSMPSAARVESGNTALIREEIKATQGPAVENIVNRMIRPGMVSAAQRRPTSPPLSPQSPPMRRIASYPGKMNGGNSLGDTPMNNRTVEEFDFDKNDLLMTPRSLMSDSIRDLPGDDSWTSPGTKMIVSPIHRSGGHSIQQVQRDPRVFPRLVVPSMIPTEANLVDNGKNAIAMPQRGKTQGQSYDSQNPTLSRVEVAFAEIRGNCHSTVSAKDAELYIRGNVLSKVLEHRLLPLIVTCLIQIPVLRMISEGSDRLCFLLGRHRQQLLIGFIPLIAAISGYLSAKTSYVTKRAICEGHITAGSYLNWVKTECEVAACAGLGMAATVGILALLCTGGSGSVVFALTVGIVQFISSTSAGCTGSVAPVFLFLLFKQKASYLDGILEQAFQDLITAFLTTVILYNLLSVLVSPANDLGDACLA